MAGDDADGRSGLEFLGLLTPTSHKPSAEPRSSGRPTLSASWTFGTDVPLTSVEPTPVAPQQPQTRREARGLNPLDAATRAPAQPAAPTATSIPFPTQPAIPTPTFLATPSAVFPPIETLRSTPTSARPPAAPAHIAEAPGSRRAARAAAPPPSKPRRGASTTKAGRPSAPRPVARRSTKGPSKVLSLAAMLFASALLVGMSVPASAFMSSEQLLSVGAARTSHDAAAQTVAVSAESGEVPAVRDSFDVISYAEVMREEYGVASDTFTPTTGAVRWPFPYSVPISDYWGYRVSPCYGCSTFHPGVDFTPGGGTPIYAIADGVVASHDDGYSGLGNNVVLSHLINGVNIESVYGHMLTGSSPLVAGEPIKVGDFVGLVGDTGSSTGNHLHLEIHIDQVAVDPFAWLTANAVN